MKEDRQASILHQRKDAPHNAPPMINANFLPLYISTLKIKKNTHIFQRWASWFYFEQNLGLAELNRAIRLLLFFSKENDPRYGLQA